MKTKKMNYFAAFIDFAQKACDAATMLNACFSDFDPLSVGEHMDRIHAVEHEADDIKHSVIKQLSREFVAQIEREDIIELVAQFDNVVDSIDEVLRRVGMYSVSRLRGDVLPFTSLLTQCCEKLAAATVEFADFRKSTVIGEKLIEINHIESEADTLHYNAIHTLFADSESAKQLLAWQDIYDTLENCFDSCEHTAEAIESVILKNT